MEPLRVVHLVLLITHFVGLAALIGPFLSQVFSRRTPRLRLMLAGATVQVITGNALIAANRLQGMEVDELKMMVKLGIAAVTLGALVAAVLVQRRRGVDAAGVRPLFVSAGGLAVADVIIAVVWR